MHLADKLRQAERRLDSFHDEQRQALVQVDERAHRLERLLQETLEMEELPFEMAAVPAEETNEPVEQDSPAAAGEAEWHADAASLDEEEPRRSTAPLRMESARPEIETPEREPEIQQLPRDAAPMLEAAVPKPTAEAPRTRPRRERAPAAPTLFPMDDPDPEASASEGETTDGLL
jgi:hypothetical protein